MTPPSRGAGPALELRPAGSRVRGGGSMGAPELRPAEIEGQMRSRVPSFFGSERSGYHEPRKVQDVRKRGKLIQEPLAE